MKTFVLMTKVTAGDAYLVEVGSKLAVRARHGRAWLKEIKRLCPEVKFLSHYAIFGYWDFMDIYEAPNDETAAKVSLLSRQHGVHEIESWPALPYEKILRISEEIDLARSSD